MIRYLLLLYSALFISNTCIAQKTFHIQSPDKNITLTLDLRKGWPVYSVSYNKQLLFKPAMAKLDFADNFFSGKIKADRPIQRDTIENYELVVGKNRHVTSRYREALIPLNAISINKHQKILFRIRLFNDGVAFRYEFPEQAGTGSYKLLDEQTYFRPAGNPEIKVLQLPGYLTSHEGFYTTSPFANITEDTLLDMPALFTFPGRVYAAITEAALHDYAGMYLSRRGDSLVTKLSPLRGNEGTKVKANLPHQSPWRVILIGNRIGTLVESNILTTLNEPSKIADVSWIKPGKTTFPWWNGNITPDTSWAPGNNFETNKYYIDFCARNGIEYHSIVEYGLHQWYVDDGVGFQPGPNADVTVPVPGLDIQEICNYAATKGVGIRFWVHWAALYPKLDSAFSLYRQWGIQGLMVDFMDRDDQEMVNIQEEILKKAAKNKLHIQFHGAYKPTGMHRTWPNEFTREGTLNYETNKWNTPGLSPSHDLDVVYTRMLAGPTDYHLGGFRAAPPDKYKVQYTRPLMAGTRCHMLGMYVVLENYQGMVCDYPEAYEGQEGFDFIKYVPTTWDETLMLGGEPGKFAAIARRKGKAWYIGIINNEEKKEIELPLHFLTEESFRAEIYSDVSAEDPNKLLKTNRMVTSSDRLQFILAAGGGGAVRILPASLNKD